MVNTIFENLTEEERKLMYQYRNEFLFQSLDIFEKHGAQAWLDCGTLLGAYRDGDYIPWDNDMDLGIKIEDVTQELLDELKSEFNVRYEGGSIEKYKFIALYKKNEKGKNFRFKGSPFWFDLYIYYPGSNGNRTMTITLKPTTKKPRKIFPVPADAVENLKTIDWYGRKVFIPSNTEKYLEQWYGPTWKTPDNKWGVSSNWYVNKKANTDITERVIDNLDSLKNKKLF